jgi:hypothetical protein
MLTPDFIRHEIDAINEKWREIQNGSERKGEALAIFYRLHIHPDLWLGITEYLANLSPVGRDAIVFPEVELLELNCDSAIEGWLILPIAELSPALRL